MGHDHATEHTREGSWRPSHSEPPPSHDALVRDFLMVTSDLPREEVARLAGVSLLTLSRWQRSTIKNVSRPVRMRMSAYLEPYGSRGDDEERA